MDFKLQLSQADRICDETNIRYPHRMLVSTPEEFKTLVSKDHVIGYYKNNTRSKDHFESANCVPLDCDNTHSSDPSQWVLPIDVHNAFPGVALLVCYSKNNMKEKKGESARPRYHVFFVCRNTITKRAVLESLKGQVQEAFPFFDEGAMDSARYFDGTPNPRIEFYDGEIGIDEFFASNSNKLDGSEIKEGSRNSSMSVIGARLIKRYGDCDEALKHFLNEAQRCTPPLEDDELDQIWRSAQKFFHDKIEKSPSYISAQDFNHPPVDFDPVEEDPSKPRKPELLSLEAFVNDTCKIEWLIKDFVYKGGSYLEYLFGESGCGKSFAALDMALTIAYGLPLWHFGKKAQQGKVLYFLGEGRPGFVKRIQAWMKAKEITEFSDSFYLYVNSAVKLNADGALAHIRSVTKELVENGWTPDLIIIDTQARFTVGDENKQMDADSYINAFNTLGAMFNATVMVVHHTSKANGETLKGSVNLKGASDINIKVEKSGKAGIKISHEKNKDGQELSDLYLGLETIELGYDDDLEPITSLVLKDSSAPVKIEDFKLTRQSKQAQKDLALIQDFIRKYGKKQGCKTIFTRLDCIEYLETYSGFSHAKAVQESHAPNSGLFARLCTARAIIDSHEIGPAPTKGKKGNPQDYEWTFNGGLEDDDFLA